MTRDEIELAVALVRDAKIDHEDSREWYDNYGWHLTTEEAGDVCLQAVEYDWLDGTDEDAVCKLLDSDADLIRDEAEALVEMARTVRDAAESVCGLLDEAVAAYDRGDVRACRQALLDAWSAESDHGDSPAASALADALLVLPCYDHGAYRTERHNLDGTGARRVRVYDVAPADGYWPAVTDVPCPICDDGTIRWAEAGYVAGYRICDGCRRHFLASGDAGHPALIRVRARRG
jgi:hypothetical protein